MRKWLTYGSVGEEGEWEADGRACEVLDVRAYNIVSLMLSISTTHTH